MRMRYRLSSTEMRDPPTAGATGIHFGLKLPTGRFNVRNGDGEFAERSLQPGTGTTDALLGAFMTRSLPLKDLSWFAQGIVQVPLNTREGYRPGQRVTLDAGLRYDATADVRRYGFLQLPVFQYVNGVQITAHKAAVLGVNVRF